MEYEKIIKIVAETFQSDLKENTVDLIHYLNSKSIIFERISGYWKNQYYYSAKYKNKSVCYILLNGTGDEKEFAPLTIWSDDSNSEWYKNYPLSNGLKKIAWDNVDYCVNCGSCSGGNQKVVFGKEFNNVCRTTMRFTNPSTEEFNVIKELVNARLDDIV